MADMMTVGPVTFAGSIWLMIAIVLGLAAVVVTYVNSRKLKGEVFEKPFILLAAGILFVTFSLIDVTFFQNFWSNTVVALVHDFSFIIGLALMMVASVQITRHLLSLDKFVKNLKR